MYENGLIRKIMLSLEFMMSQTGEQTIVIHMLPNISRRIWSVSRILYEEYFPKKVIYKIWWRIYSQTLF